MMRKFSLALAVMSALYGTNAYSLGLGGVQVKSKLNQPLSAQIDVMSIPAGDLNNLRVALANNDAFKRAGLDKPVLLSTIDFRIEGSGDGRSGTIYLSTAQPIKEPFLNFLIEVNWPKGRILREYTVLLDPPTYDISQAAPTVRAAQVAPTMRAQAAPERPQAQIVPFDPTPTQVAPPPRVAPAYTGGDYSTRKRDTLWEIAAKVMPHDGSISQHQMMTAIFHANENAFINGNMNLIKSGQTLRIPSASEAAMYSEQESVRTFVTHEARWQGKATRTPISKDTAEKIAAKAPTDKSGSAMLRLASAVSAERDKSPTAGERRVPDDKGTAPLRDIQEQVKDLHAENQRIQKENQYLTDELGATKNRVGELQEEVQKLITLQKSLYAQLEEQLKKQNQQLEDRVTDALESIRHAMPTTVATPATAAQVMPAEQPVATTPVETPVSEPETMFADGLPNEPLVTSVEEEQLVEEEPLFAEEPLRAETPELSETPLLEDETLMAEAEESLFAQGEEAPVQTQPSREPTTAETGGVMDVVMANLPYIGGGLGVLLLGAGGFAAARKLREKKQAAREESAATPLPADAGGDDSEALFAEVENLIGHQGEGAEIGENDADDEEILQEVDVYIAYERYEQAQSTIDSALAQNPSHLPYHLKRLEVDAALHDADAFEEHAQNVHQLTGGEGPDWELTQSLWQSMDTGRALNVSASPASGAVIAGAAIAGVAGAAALAATESDNFDLSDTTQDLGSLDHDDLGLDLGDDSQADDLGLNFDQNTDETGLDLDLGEESHADDLDLDLNFEGDETLSLDSDLSGAEEDLDLDLDHNDEVALDEELNLDLGESDDVDLDLDLDSSTDISADEDLNLDMGDSDFDENAEEMSFDDNLDLGALDDSSSADIDLSDDSGGISLDEDLGLGDDSDTSLDFSDDSGGISLDEDLGLGDDSDTSLDFSDDSGGISLDEDLGLGDDSDTSLDFSDDSGGISLDEDLGLGDDSDTSLDFSDDSGGISLDEDLGLSEMTEDSNADINFGDEEETLSADDMDLSGLEDSEMDFGASEELSSDDMDLSGLEDSEMDFGASEELSSDDMDLGGLEDSEMDFGASEELSSDDMDLGGLEDSEMDFGASEELSSDDMDLGGLEDSEMDFGASEELSSDDMDLGGLEDSEMDFGASEELSSDDMDLGGLEDSEMDFGASEELSSDDMDLGGLEDSEMDFGASEELSSDDSMMGDLSTDTLSDMDGDFGDLLGGLEEDSDFGEIDFGEGDQISAKFDLVQMYLLDMDDIESARATLEEIVREGDAEQQARAQEMLETLATPA
jgi:pilus assembly protein FimV